MAAGTQFEQFVAQVDRRLSQSEMKSRKETIATPQEVGWWKRFQFTRMIRHARAGEATLTELRYLARHGIHYPPARSRQEHS